MKLIMLQFFCMIWSNNKHSLTTKKSTERKNLSKRMKVKKKYWS